MTCSEVSIDTLRERWRRVRRQLNLTDVESPSYGTGGLGRRLGEPSVRLIILPADPDHHVIDFTHEAYEWWELDKQDPALRRSTSWGPMTVTAEALVRYEKNGKDQWSRYFGLYRHGGVDMGLGTDGAWGVGDKRLFGLVPIVGKIWAVLAAYSEVIQKYKIAGPWEITLALLRTEGTQLSGVARGWRDPLRDGFDMKPCQEKAVFHSRSICAWPEDNELQELAFQIGTVIDNAWGFHQRRFLVNVNGEPSIFDTQHYRWW